ncbi:hypothetical protein WJ96_05375 [Burkholderia ubonensis]|uniref:Uncharacterized protein n=1 Tax=Burkholderia ubonensis TaxID=101571 RepID=A0AAW3MXF9_9BURK|nr:hypothetical protein [Burkholderia ubonensis]KVP98003.1 hypothetical protein WJ96_05375 [Burkholderia ubonensis]KVZ92700.1 hypothetical protein WL25_17035 [Burkholderia ubonensis]
MQHFSLVYDLCRAALAGDKTLGAQSSRKLRDALAGSGDTEDADDAELLSRLIQAATGKSRKPVVHFVQSDTPAGES